jgi:hypothetical protein
MRAAGAVVKEKYSTLLGYAPSTALKQEATNAASTGVPERDV